MRFKIEYCLSVVYVIIRNIVIIKPHKLPQTDESKIQEFLNGEHINHQWGFLTCIGMMDLCDQIPKGVTEDMM